MKLASRLKLKKKRIYPYQNAGSHIVGYVDIDNQGIAGSEWAFNNKLNNGSDIYLTIDIMLQNAVSNELAETVNKFSAESGSVNYYGY